ncbi:MAG: hypothetical protein A2X22_03280 [Bacteroidetes bacterium GWF2_49_14]|nr:MAG: hypothetical protein A2X22_03280 [Bacteroidetes bacterium GWF2_49_14]
MILDSTDTIRQDEIPILEEEFPVYSFLVDARKKLSIPSLFGLMVEIAHHDAERRGWGYSGMIAQNQAWVFLRSLIRVGRMPEWGETIRIRTWPKTMEGITAYRDIQFRDAGGEVIISATTLWSIIDLEKRKPVRLTPGEYTAGKHANMHAVEEKPVKIHGGEALHAVNSFRAAYNHTDMNLHVNNARYIDWVLNEMPVKLLKERDIREIQVNFNAELLVDDKVEILLDDRINENGAYVGVIRNGQTGQQAFAISFKF